MPEGIDEFDAKSVRAYIKCDDGSKIELHGWSKPFPLDIRNRRQRRAKMRNPRDHAKFYRKDQSRPWIK